MSDLELTMMRRVGELNKEVASLKAEVERLTALVESNLNKSKLAMAKSDASVRTLEAHIERLTKAGDAMAEEMGLETYAEEHFKQQKEFLKAWNAAKEGKQS